MIGTLVFIAPIDLQTKLHLLDIEDTGHVIREILINPETFIGHDICISGEAIRFADSSKVFTKVTGKAAISKTINEEEFRSMLYQMPIVAQDDLVDRYKWFEEYGYYDKDKDWATGQKLWKLKPSKTGSNRPDGKVIRYRSQQVYLEETLFRRFTISFSK